MSAGKCMEVEFFNLGGMVLLPLKEYDARVKERDYAFEQLLENGRRIEELRGEVEGLKQDKDAIDAHLVACFQALQAIKFSAGEILGGSASCAYVHVAAARIKKLCEDALLNRVESKEGEEAKP